MAAPPTTDEASSAALLPWRLPVGLWLAAALGLTIRLYVVLVQRPTCEPWDEPAEGCRELVGDSMFFFLQGRRLAEGDLYVNPFVPGNEPMAGDPPLFAAVLALFTRLGIDTPHGQRIALCFIGAAGIVLTGLLAGRLAGSRAAVITGVLAATYPMLWINDGQMMSESIYIPLVAAFLIGAYQLYERPTAGRALALGALIALASLARAEAAFLLVILVVPLVLGFRGLPFVRRAALCGLAGVGGAVVLAPWILFNLARFEVPTTMTSGPGSVLLSSSCDGAFSGDLVGYYSFDCFLVPLAEEPVIPTGADQSVSDAGQRTVAEAYLEEHWGELPRVAVFRIARVWDLYRPLQSLELNAGLEERGRGASELGLATYYALVPLAAAGLWVLRRRGLPISPFVALVVTATLVAATTFGVTRYRVPVDVGFVVLAGVAIDAAWRRWAPELVGFVRGEPTAEQMAAARRRAAKRREAGRDGLEVGAGRQP